MLHTFLGIFRTNGPASNLSFGRVFTGIGYSVCLFMLVFAVLSDRSSQAIELKCWDSEKGVQYTKSVLASKFDWTGYSAFLTAMGVFGAATFGLGKLLEKPNQQPTG